MFLFLKKSDLLWIYIMLFVAPIGPSAVQLCTETVFKDNRTDFV